MFHKLVDFVTGSVTNGSNLHPDSFHYSIRSLGASVKKNICKIYFGQEKEEKNGGMFLMG